MMKIFAIDRTWKSISKCHGKPHLYLLWMLLVAAAGSWILFGCAAGKHRMAGTYVPGIYKGVGEGMHGDVIVETEFSASRLIAVRVVKHEDTPGLSDAAIKMIPAAVLEAQNTEVDAVSGATVTSGGIKEAIQSAISQALRK